MNLGAQKDCAIREHQSQLSVTDRCRCGDKHWVDQAFIFLDGVDSIVDNFSNVSQNLLSLRRKHTQENNVAGRSNLLVVEQDVYTKLRLILLQQMGLPCRNRNLEVPELVFDLYQLRKQRGAHLASTNNPHLVWWEVIRLRQVLHADLAALS